VFREDDRKKSKKSKKEEICNRIEIRALIIINSAVNALVSLCTLDYPWVVKGLMG